MKEDVEEESRVVGGVAAESLSLKSISTKRADTEAGIEAAVCVVVSGPGTVVVEVEVVEVVVGVVAIADGMIVVEGGGGCGCWRCHSALRCIIRRRARCFCFLGLRLALDAGLPFGLAVALSVALSVALAVALSVALLMALSMALPVGVVVISCG